MKSVIVTGSRGFIGTELVKYLTLKGYDIVPCDRKDCQEVQTLANRIITTNEYDDVCAIIHLAAQTSVFNGNIQAIVRDNIASFTEIVNASNRKHIRLIYASSSCAVNVTSMYGISKHFNESYANVYAENAIGLRFHNVYGPNPRKDTLIGTAFECCKTGRSVKLFNSGKNKRHFTFVGDVLKGIESLIESNQNGIANIVNPQETTTEAFIAELQRYINVRYELCKGKREYDKEQQLVENDLTLKLDYTNVEDGIRMIFK